MRLGAVSDTHGLVRPEAIDFLRGVDHIVHAGDIGSPATLAAFAALAPLTVVRGNNDIAPWAKTLPEFALVQLEGISLLVLHDLADLPRRGITGAVSLVISGHSHQPRLATVDGVTYLNPGSAGPRRFALPISVAEVLIAEGSCSARLVMLQCAPAPAPGVRRTPRSARGLS